METIPFLTLFILLNYDCITSSWEKPKQISGDCILKSANYCAKKFINSDQIDQDHFVRYCIKQAKSMIKDEPIPNKEDKADLKRILKVYDQMYYSKVEEIVEHSDAEDQSICEYTIPQFDGGNDSD